MVVCSQRFVIAFGLSLLISAPALAASQQDWDNCQSKDPAIAIAACSAIIPDETETAQNRADAFVFRAGAYLAQGDLDHAIADYGDALKLTPRNIVAYVSRALAEFKKGDKDKAILDYSIANRLDADAVARITSGNSEVQKIADATRASPPPASALGVVDQLLSLLQATPPPSPPPPRPAPAPPAPPAPPPKPWNAIASSLWKVKGRVHVAIGYSGTRPTEEEARESAVDACKDAGGTTCKSTGAWNFGCVYITTGSATRRAGWASGNSLDAALAKCRDDGFTCKQPIGGCVE
jgi:tetratricopeptide (TPR) repeat protein